MLPGNAVSFEARRVPRAIPPSTSGCVVLNVRSPRVKCRAKLVTARPPVSGSTPYTMTDRKSTRLNSSHGYISYAVFCLKKKKKNKDTKSGTQRTDDTLYE